MINLKQISHVIALAEQGSISGAAQYLNIAQPSMSESIAKLEKQLGIQLAVRGSRGIQLTEAGAMFAKRGNELLLELNQFLASVQEMSSTPKGQLSVGLPQALGSLASVSLVETLFAEFPDIQISIAEAMSGDILKWLEEGRLDLGCVYEATDSGTFVYEPVFDEEMFLVAATDNWRGAIGADGLAAEKITATELASLPLVSTSRAGRGARKAEEKISKSAGAPLNIIAALDSAPQMIELVTRASAYAILPHSAVHREVERQQLTLVRISEVDVRRTVYIARKRDRLFSHVMRLTMEDLKVVLLEAVTRRQLIGTRTISFE